MCKRSASTTLMILSVLVAVVLAAEETPPPKAPPVDTAPYCGDYRLPCGKRLSVFMMGPIQEMASLSFIDWETGRMGNLFPAGTDIFASEPAGQPDAVPQTRITFQRGPDGTVQSSLVAEKGGRTATANRETIFTDEKVKYPSGNITLGGTVKTPKGQGPFPAIVLIHGSGPGTRCQLEAAANFFAGLGVAALTYDKQGCGESSGNWKAVDLEALATDALAGVAYLKTRKDIDTGKVGLWGVSQGGWIVPLAASMSDAPAFAINHSGPATSLRKQDLFMMDSVLAMQGIPKESAALVTGLYDTIFDYARGKRPAEAVTAAVQAAMAKPELKEIVGDVTLESLNPELLYKQQAIGDPAWFYHLDPDRDAVTPYKKMKCPLLVIYGKLDYTIPVEESVANLQKTLPETGRKNWELKVLERMGHGIVLMRPDMPAKPVTPMGFVPEYFALIETWLRAQGILSACR